MEKATIKSEVLDELLAGEREVIDHLLQVPEVKDPIRLVRPGVFYQYADPQLGRRSASAAARDGGSDG